MSGFNFVEGSKELVTDTMKVDLNPLETTTGWRRISQMTARERPFNVGVLLSTSSHMEHILPRRISKFQLLSKNASCLSIYWSFGPSTTVIFPQTKDTI